MILTCRFHLLSEFDNGKRSCRKRLADHNRRRRKTQQPSQEIQKSQPSLDNVASTISFSLSFTLLLLLLLSLTMFNYHSDCYNGSLNNQDLSSDNRKNQSFFKFTHTVFPKPHLQTVLSDFLSPTCMIPWKLLVGRRMRVFCCSIFELFFWRISTWLRSPVVVGDGGGVTAGLFPAEAVSEREPFHKFKLTVFLQRVVHVGAV